MRKIIKVEEYKGTHPLSDPSYKVWFGYEDGTVYAAHMGKEDYDLVIFETELLKQGKITEKELGKLEDLVTDRNNYDRKYDED